MKTIKMSRSKTIVSAMAITAFISVIVGEADSSSTAATKQATQLTPDRLKENPLRTLKSTIRDLAELAPNPETQEALNRQTSEIITIWKQIEDWIATTLQSEKERLTRNLPSIDPSFQFDPWAGIDKAPPAFPTIGNIQFESGNNVRRPPKDYLRHCVPRPFRLAEYLGLGQNHFHATTSYDSPHLFFDRLSAYEIRSRVRHEFFGTFVLNSTSKSIETFRRLLPSQDFVGSVEIRISPEVKPHHYSLREIPIEERYERNTFSPWYTERMDLRFPGNALTILPSRQSRLRQEADTEQLHQQLKNRLKEYRRTMTQSITDATSDSPPMSHLQRLLKDLQERLQNSHQSDDTTPCSWALEFPSIRDWIPELVDRVAQAQARPSTHSSSLPDWLVTALIHRARHEAAPKHSTLATELAWRARWNLQSENHSARVP